MSEDLAKTRCLFCSLQCPVALTKEASGEIGIAYLRDDAVTQGRLCFRGHYVADLADHPMRLSRAEARNGGVTRADQPESLEEVLRKLGSRLRSAGKNAAILVDGNMPTEGIIACLRFGAGSLGTDRVAIYLPPTDRAMLRGLRSDVSLLPLEEVGKCDVFLAVGDVLATHPMIGRHVMDAKWGNRARILGMDCMANRVADFADRFLYVKPGGEASTLAAMAKMAGGGLPKGHAWADADIADLVAASGAEESALRSAVEALSDAKQPGIFLAPVPGRMTNVAAAAAAACALCEAGKARLMPMFRYGNAVGAGQAALDSDVQAPDEVLRAVLEGKVEVLLSIGVDVMRMLTAEEAEALRRRVSTLAIASPLRNRSTEEADFVLPLAAWFEQGGKVSGTDAEPVSLSVLLDPPGAALSTCDLMARLAGAAGALPPSHATLPEGRPFQGATAERVRISEQTETGLRLVARAATVDFDLGSETRQCSWATCMEPDPELLVSASDAKNRNLTPQTWAGVRANGQEARVRIRCGQQMPVGTVAVSTAFEQGRRLFLQRLDGVGQAELAPTECDVTVEVDE